MRLSTPTRIERIEKYQEKVVFIVLSWFKACDSGNTGVKSKLSISFKIELLVWV
jgi:hypothetical protein